MRYSKLMLAAVLGALGIQLAVAAPTPEEAAQLGKTLTPFGAIKAGNKEGTIPEYTGGICTPPPGYKPLAGMAMGGAPYVDPFADDKPLYKITAADVAKYGDLLDEGAKELFRRFPQTYYLLVYPTRRSACSPDYAYENTIKHVMRPKLVGDNTGLVGAKAQIPFPIPKNGYEAIWNNSVKFEWPYTLIHQSSWLVNASGKVTPTAIHWTDNANYYWDNNIKDPLPDDHLLSASNGLQKYPASTFGSISSRQYYLRMDLKGRPAYSYTPGQRRVRLAPEFSYDGVVMSTGGVFLYDEISGFDGKMDRFDFKLMGRKEMIIPYNDYKFNSVGTEALTPNHADPATLRWELHRVWVVEATLKPGERHVQKKKVFYIDEDSWNILVYNGFDKAGKIHHGFYFAPIQTYDKPEFRNQTLIGYDFPKRAYIVQSKFDGLGINGDQQLGVTKSPPMKPSFFSPEAIAGRGLR